MVKNHRIFAILCMVMFGSVMMIGSADTIIVPDDQPTIQEGIDNAIEGDTVLVKPGTYVENIRFQRMDIHLKSRNGPWLTVIDGNRSSSVVTVPGSAVDVTIEGFTITNGSGTIDGLWTMGGGIHCEGYGTRIIGNIIRNNLARGTSFGWGGGIYCLSSAARICNNMIYHNRADSVHSGRGGGLYTTAGHSMISNNLIFQNSARTQGGGIFCRTGDDPCFFLSTTIYQNSAQKGGGLYFDNLKAICTHLIMWENSAVDGKELFIDGIASFPTQVGISYSNVQGGLDSVEVVSPNILEWGQGMIDADPLFVNPAAVDFRLQQDPCQPGVYNPCVDAGGNLSFNEAMDNCWTRTSGEGDDGVVDLGFHHGPYMRPTFRSNGYTLSAATGGSVLLYLHAMRENKYRNYLILGGASGYEPGFDLPGGHATLPVNWDAWTDEILALINTPFFPYFMGTTSLEGYAEAKIDVGPIDPGGVGAVLHFAYALNEPFDFASTPVRVDIVP